MRDPHINTTVDRKKMSCYIYENQCLWNMAVIEPRPGLFLSADAIVRAREIFAVFRSKNPTAPPLGEVFNKSASTIFSDEWAEHFDDLYLGVYYLNLTSKELTRSPLPRSKGHAQRAIMTVMIDQNLPKIDEKTPFEETLFSEAVISDLIRIRGSVQNLIPYETSLSKLFVGCLWLEFSILACTRFRRHQVRCFNGTGGASWNVGSLHGSSSLRLFG